LTGALLFLAIIDDTVLRIIYNGEKSIDNDDALIALQ